MSRENVLPAAYVFGINSEDWSYRVVAREQKYPRTVPHIICLQCAGWHAQKLDRRLLINQSISQVPILHRARLAWQ